VTGEQAAAQGYRRVSNKHMRVTRIDRPDWVRILAEHTRRSEAQFYRPGSLHPEGAWADFYRRVLSKDWFEFSDRNEFSKVPGSDFDDTGYVPPVVARP
jgi:hypothetical protein